MEVMQPEFTLHNEDIPVLESSLALSEPYSISDFTIADPSSFDLGVGLQKTFDEYQFNLLHSITEDDTVDIAIRRETEPSFETTEDNNNNNIIETIESLQTVETVETESFELDGDGNAVFDTSEEIRIEEPINNFDFSKLANFVYQQEPIDGDPARPSPVHRIWDTGQSDDSEGSTSAIASVILGEDPTFLREDEYEGMSLVEEIVTVQRVKEVETAFNFDVSSMLCYAMLCNAMLCNAMLCYAMLCYAMLCYAMLCYAMLCYAMLCYAMLCYAMLCYAMLC